MLTSTSITERALIGENERTFTERLLRIDDDQKGTIEIVFKNDRPNYAFITFRQDKSVDS